MRHPQNDDVGAPGLRDKRWVTIEVAFELAAQVSPLTGRDFVKPGLVGRRSKDVSANPPT